MTSGWGQTDPDGGGGSPVLKVAVSNPFLNNPNND